MTAIAIVGAEDVVRVVASQGHKPEHMTVTAGRYLIPKRGSLAGDPCHGAFRPGTLVAHEGSTSLSHVLGSREVGDPGATISREVPTALRVKRAGNAKLSSVEDSTQAMLSIPIASLSTIW